jgi:hypothetical protein
MCPEDDQLLSDLEEWPGIQEQSHPNPIPDAEPDSYDSDWESEPENNEAEFAWDEKPPVQDWRGNPYAVIVDISGIHHLTVQYCRCDGHKPDDEQMLELGFFPASFKRSRTFFTFRLLDDFRLDNLESKTSAYQYYAKLRRVTSPAFPHSTPVSHIVQCTNGWNLIWET